MITWADLMWLAEIAVLFVVVVYVLSLWKW
jgi:hypothetical protein